MGAYLEPVPLDALPAARLLDLDGPVTAGRFCDDDGDYKRRYNVYKLTANGKACVLKKSDSREVTLYRDFLHGRGFAVPEYLDTGFPVDSELVDIVSAFVIAVIITEAFRRHRAV